MKNLAITLSLLTLAPAPATFAQDDGAPHLAVAQEEDGSLVLEYEVPDFSLNESTTPPTITLDVSVYDDAFPGYRTFPVSGEASPDPTPNNDLGFVSEVEGEGEEGDPINGNIVVRASNQSANFRAFFGGEEIFTTAEPDLVLGSAFDRHPLYLAANVEGDLTAATASFEVFDINTGAIGQGATSLGGYNLILAVPEPTSLALLAGLGGVAMMRRRRHI